MTLRPLFVFFSTVCFALAALIPPFLAFHYPLELEAREGAGWLHLLARQAGVKLYDTTMVAFANLIYGPADLLLKSALAYLLPTLESFQITRIFVPFVPFTLILAAWGWRAGLMDAVLLSCPLFLVLTCTDLLATLIGRSDPLAFCLINLLFFLIAPRIKAHFAARERLWLCLVGLVATLLFHSSWRFAPAIFFMVGGSLVSFSLPAPAGWTAKKFFRDVSWLGGLFLLLSVAFVYGEYGSFSAYAARTFGTYTSASGWGVFPAKVFSFLPNFLIKNAPLFIGGAWLASLVTFWLNRQKRDELTFWIPALVLSWILYSLGYYANGEGGGVRYFYPALLLLWVAGLHLFGPVESRLPQWRVWFCLLVWVGVPWNLMADLQKVLWTNGVPARQVLSELRRVPRLYLWSDCFHFFKTRYEGDVIDTPDTALKIAQSGYLGPDFSRLVKDHFARLEKNPLPYYLSGQLDPPQVTEFYRRPEYRKLLEAPLHTIGNGFLHSATLYGKK